VNEEYTFRQLVWDEDKRYFLKALNEACETVEIPGLHVVKGVVVQKAGRRRSERKHYV
jgi:SOS-response transcriptional repressor LexA